MLLSFLPIAAIQLIAIVLAVGYIIATAPRGKDNSQEGRGFGPTDNQADPKDPVPVGWGKPKWLPPLLARWVRPFNLNSIVGQPGQGIEMLFDCGWGRHRGTDLSAWLNDTPIYEKINENSSLPERRLFRIPSTNTYLFPKPQVVADSIVLLQGGKILSVGSAAENPDEDNFKQVHRSFDALPKQFTEAGLVNPVPGAYLPVSNVYNLSVIVVIGVRFGTTLINTVQHTLTERDGGLLVRIEKGTGRNYFIINPAFFFPGNPDAYFKPGGGGLPVRGVKGEMNVQYDELVLTDDDVIQKYLLRQTDDGITSITFSEDQGAVAIEAHYRTLPLGIEVKTEFHDGSLNQAPFLLPNGAEQSHIVDQPLVQGASIVYTTKRATDDIVIGIDSGGLGFFDRAIHSRNAGEVRDAEVQVLFEVKTTSAPDANLNVGVDPNLGWVRIGFTGTDLQTLRAKITGGPAHWAFSVRDMFAAKVRRIFGTTFNIDQILTDIYLPRGLYNVRVTRATPASTLDRIENSIVWVFATEQIEDMFSWPHRSMLRLSFDVTEAMPAEPTVKVQFDMRMPRKYTGTQTVPYYKQWFQARFIDMVEFVYDPDLKERIFIEEWSRNPVWAACEAITDIIWGGGVVGFTDDNIDWDSALAAANFCDLEVTWGGRTGPRSEIDGVFTKRTNLYDMIGTMLAGSQVGAVLSGGVWKFIIDDDKTTGITFIDKDIIVSETVFTTPKIEEVPNALEISFPDEERDWKDDVPVYIPPPEPVRVGFEESDRLILNVKDMHFPLVRRRRQIERVGAQMREDIQAATLQALVRPNGWRHLGVEQGDKLVWTSVEYNFINIPWRVTSTSGGMNLKREFQLSRLSTTPVLPSGSGVGFEGPNSGVVPDIRPPSDQQPRTLTSRITGITISDSNSP